MLKHLNEKPIDPARVVVLGARGFIGRALVAALQQAGITVMPVSSADLDLTAEDAGDRLAAMLKPDDAIVLLSALTPDKGRGLQPFLSNIRMAASLCHALAKVTPSHVVYFSSDSVYPMRTGLISEETCAEPEDLYGMMHLAREMMIKSATKVPVAVLRTTLVYGAADTHNSYGPNRLRRMARKDGKIALFGQGEETRDHIPVEDVAGLTILALRHRSAGTLNVATGCSVSYAELAKKVAALFDRPVEIAGAARQSPITHRHFDVTNLRKAFPTFVFTPLEKGLAKAHREMMEQG
jgi:nucleoside-diphosphate-sugar epimerase